MTVWTVFLKTLRLQLFILFLYGRTQAEDGFT